MVAQLADLPAPCAPDFARAPGSLVVTGKPSPGPALRGRLLLERASTLAHVRAGGRGIRGFAGVALSVAADYCNTRPDSFLRQRVFAVVGDDGALCLRLPADIAADLYENGLATPIHKHMLTWPVESPEQLELNWRILLRSYWHATNLQPRRSRRLWSEWIIQH